MSTFNTVIERARDFVYDREDFDGFLTELLAGDEDDQRSAQDYLVGNGLAIVRLHTKGHRSSPWFWMDRSYTKALTQTVKGSDVYSLELLGKGKVEAEALAAMGL